jgi:ribose transport system ATP-binding protein
VPDLLRNEPSRPGAEPGRGAAVPLALEAHGLTKRFGGVHALRGVDLAVRAGETHGLIGHNGAGKSTLIKVLTAVHPSGSYGGEVKVGGRVADFGSPAAARAAGVGYVPQETQVLEHLSVAENIFVGQMALERTGWVRFGDVHRAADALLAQCRIPLRSRQVVGGLSAAQRQLVMVARAIASEPSVLLLDEPTTSLSATETDRLFDVLRGLRANGVTMVLITHRLPEVLAMCDRATVLRDGHSVATFDRAEMDEDAIVDAMVGRKVKFLFPERSGSEPGAELLRVRGLRVPSPTGGDLVRDVGFGVRAGEILGIAGLVGSGRTEVLSAVYGRLKRTGGEILVEGAPTTIRRPADARRAGIAFLTEDRRREGVLFNFSARQNITIGNLAGFSRGSWVQRRAESAAAAEFVRSLAIRTPSLEADVDHLSGGTQQKLLLARVLMQEPRVLFLDEPTKGVDVETKHEIYKLVADLAERGVAIVLVSSELEELLGLSDRCVVLADGRIVDEFPSAEGSEERIIAATTTGGRDRTTEVAA